MPIKATHFQLHELVCNHVYKKYGEQAWQFLDPRLVITIDWVREDLNKPIFINNYQWGGRNTQSGLRCNLCDLVKSKTLKNIVYLSAHIRAQAADFSIKGITASEVRVWLKQHEDRLPYPIRLENGVNWVHLDVIDTGVKVYIFNP